MEKEWEEEEKDKKENEENLDNEEKELNNDENNDDSLEDQKDNSSDEPKIKKKVLPKKRRRKVPKIKSPPALAKPTDEQVGKTENNVFVIGDGIKINVELKYIREKKNQSSEEDEENEEQYEKIDITFKTNYLDELILHWGIYRVFRDSEWIHPSKNCYPEYSKEFDKKAIQTEFTEDETETEPTIRMMIPSGKGFQKALGGMNFVIYEPLKKKWYNNNNKNFQIKFRIKNKMKSNMIVIDENLTVPYFAFQIIICEATYSSWTLMHRYNKCSDIINDWDEKTPVDFLDCHMAEI